MELTDTGSSQAVKIFFQDYMGKGESRKNTRMNNINRFARLGRSAVSLLVSVSVSVVRFQLVFLGI